MTAGAGETSMSAAEEPESVAESALVTTKTSVMAEVQPAGGSTGVEGTEGARTSRTCVSAAVELGTMADSVNASAEAEPASDSETGVSAVEETEREADSALVTTKTSVMAKVQPAGGGKASVPAVVEPEMEAGSALVTTGTSVMAEVHPAGGSTAEEDTGDARASKTSVSAAEELGMRADSARVFTGSVPARGSETGEFAVEEPETVAGPALVTTKTSMMAEERPAEGGKTSVSAVEESEREAGLCWRCGHNWSRRPAAAAAKMRDAPGEKTATPGAVTGCKGPTPKP